jgi:hypothetical protein
VSALSFSFLSSFFFLPCPPSFRRLDRSRRIIKNFILRRIKWKGIKCRVLSLIKISQRRTGMYVCSVSPVEFIFREKRSLFYLWIRDFIYIHARVSIRARVRILNDAYMGDARLRARESSLLFLSVSPSFSRVPPSHLPMKR